MISDKAKEWLNEKFSYTNPWFMNSETVWNVLSLAKGGNENAIQVWKEYSKKVKLPEDPKEVNFKSYKDLINVIYRW